MIYKIRLKGEYAGSVIDYWWEHNCKCDMRVRRCATPGEAEIDTDDSVMARYIEHWFEPISIQIIDDRDGKASV